MIDIDNRVIWVTPVVKSSYTDSSTLIIETAGLAIKSPLTNAVNRNQFTIRYYTWLDSQSQPAIGVGSDDWCFMKQDSSQISSSSISKITYTSSTFSQHTYLSVPDQLYVNEW